MFSSSIFNYKLMKHFSCCRSERNAGLLIGITFHYVLDLVGLVNLLIVALS